MIMCDGIESIDLVGGHVHSSIVLSTCCEAAKDEFFLPKWFEGLDVREFFPPSFV